MSDLLNIALALLADLWLLSGVVYVLLKTCGDE